MKFPHILSALCAGALLAACNSLDSPLQYVSNIGHDGRVYNTNTGSWDWPEEHNVANKQKQRNAEIATTLKSTPTPAKKIVAKATTTPIPVATRITPVPMPANGTWVYNAETGKFDWAPSGAPPIAKPEQAQPAPAPAPTGNGAPLFPQ
jgi:hypothetical protein